ncbi:hypothetical protein Alches_13690 [Alicyclobacillus hesperidum subsp. aegles]|uniref:ribonuclease H-like domain-containing protein n=1 Tax=Alicyclobacillus hesperidum TaxID=89784 RepID=UPI0007193A66|nr:ribonuclease H-like domain-containing protein [Alicyclobacillus hesperidum]KRW91277.1 hypothetical protein SD51_10005 [Alicyclobacillus tengchongensis]GLG01330.1 hypothetical protein Alches_13690 [Alicyclobacillus hesperidum subsp. aegles]
MARSLLDKLRALEQSVRGVTGGPVTADDNPPVSGDHRQPSVCTPRDEELLEAGFRQITTDAGRCWCRTTSFDVFTKHGERPFLDVFDLELAPMAKLAKAPIAIANLCFYDTETNGLGLGSGTLPFLHSVGYFIDDEFCVDQYFVDDYGAEGAVLAAMEAGPLGDTQTVVVTFNGKSFDWPLLQNRRVLHQMPRIDRAQLDLLHPSRRLWKDVLGRVSLAEVERLLGVTRMDDLPGREAPARYFEFVGGAPFSVMEDVFRHNLHDVCSLVGVLIAIAEALSGRAVYVEARPNLAIATWFDAWHDWEAAANAYRRAAAADDADWRAFWLFSLFLKRRGLWDEAVRLWWEMAESYPQQPEPLVELAKYYEHRAIELHAARQATSLALERVQRASREETALLHRLERIERKLATKARADLA